DVCSSDLRSGRPYSFTVNKAVLTVTPDPQKVTYGTADPTFSFNYNGFVLGQTSAALTTQATCAVPGSSPHAAGTYTISCAAGTAANYNFNVAATATFTVNKAVLTVTPDPQTVTHATADATLI